MVDWQKALLMVLLALLIYPNDIFGKHQILINPADRTSTNVTREIFGQSVLIVKCLFEMVINRGDHELK